MLQRLLLVLIALMIFIGGYRFGFQHADGLGPQELDQAAPPELADVPRTGLVATKVQYDDLPRWADDLPFSALPADWEGSAAAYIEAHFFAEELTFNDQTDGLMTGYYAPMIDARLSAQPGFTTPLHARPDDLVSINLARFDPALKGKSIHGRWDSARQAFVPYDDRAAITARDDMVPIAYVKDDVTRFFLQIQGSGLLRLADGSLVRAAYAGKNGHPYVAIGRALIDNGAIAADDMSMQAIRDWLYANPEQAKPLMATNRAFIFFSLSDDVTIKGAAHVPLIADHSVAVDPAYHAYGALLYVVNEETGTGRIVRADDTGSAIKGPLRLDLYRGVGDDAALAAGDLAAPIKLYRLTRRPIGAKQSAATDPNRQD